MKIKFLSNYDKAKNLLKIISDASNNSRNSSKVLNRVNTNIPAYKKNSTTFDTFVSSKEKAAK